MQCREFRNHHVAFVDDLLSAADMSAMRDHLSDCRECSRQDVLIRRSLLVVRNLPTIEPSPDFMLRLNERLRVARTENVAATIRWRARKQTGWPNVPALAAAAALVIGALVYAIGPWQPTPAVVATAPVPQSAPSVLASETSVPEAAVLATVPATIPVWSAMLTVGQMPAQIATVGFSDGLTR